MKVDLNLFKDIPLEESALFKSGVIKLNNVTDDMKLVYALGFRDRILSEVDKVDYKRFSKAETINQLVYLAGFLHATVDINLAEFDIDKIVCQEFVDSCAYGIITNNIHLLKHNVEVILDQ